MPVTEEIRQELNHLANTLRFLAVDTVQKANSGHPGMPMGMADVAAVLWSQYLKFDPRDPAWPDRDRFVLSGGHGSSLLYALLHISGYDLSLDDLKNFRQLGSRTPGHPEQGHTPGVETTTGPLGQGLGNAVGMALSEAWLGEKLNLDGQVFINHRTWAFAGDGDLMEGISHEVCSLAGQLGLGKLTLFFDDNGISIDGPTSLTTHDDTVARFTAYGWHVQKVDGHDAKAIAQAIDAALMITDKPSLIACRTHIGYGSPNKQDSSGAHGSPLGDDEIRITKQHLGWPVEPSFLVPDEARALLTAQAKRGQDRHTDWTQQVAEFCEKSPEAGQVLKDILHDRLPEGWQKALPVFAAGDKIATRSASGAVITALAGVLPNLLGGSADLTPSNNTRPRGGKALKRDDLSGRYIHFGVREFGMAAVLNGMAVHGGLIPYGGTFLVFSDYMRHALRLAAMMRQRVIFVLTHDSIGLGEDGPTHQPVEQVMSLRMIPGLTLWRPADAAETAVAWAQAVAHQGPSVMALTRQNLPVLDRERYADVQGAARGAYVCSDVDKAQVILIGTGSELHIALDAQTQLGAEGIAARVVSMPSWEVFAAQDQAYRDSVLPPSLRARVAVEAGIGLGWERYTGDQGRFVGMSGYGASAPFKQLYAHFGITAEAMVAAAKQCLA